MSRREVTAAPQVLYLDRDVLVVDKPAGMLSVPGRGQAPCLLDLLPPPPDAEEGPRLTAYTPNGRKSPWRVVHRLDRDASGVQLYAATLEAQRHLAAQFQNHRVEKVYYALVCGYVASDGQIDLPLRFDRHLQRTVVCLRRGKPALTRYRILERVAGNTLLECRPVTGRRHQIRAHLSAIGHPLSVDPLYGSSQEILLSQYKPDYKPNRTGQERPLISRLTLHAARITFEHPRTGERITVEAPMPKDLRATLRQLARFA